jgi:tetratricopeptide (TPR) repeat protein
MAKPKQTLDDLYNLSVELLNQKDFSGAKKYLNLAFEIDPSNPYLHYLSGTIKSRLHEYETAIEDYSKALEIIPDLTQAYFFRGFAKMQTRNYTDAITDFNKYIEFKPDDTRGYHIRAQAKIFTGDFEGAVRDYTRLIEIKPEISEFYLLRGIARESLADNSGYIEDITKAYEIGLDEKQTKFYLYRDIVTWQLRINGGLGISKEIPIVIEYNPDYVTLEYAFLDLFASGRGISYELIKQQLIKDNGKKIDQITIKTTKYVNGEEITHIENIFFDITDSFGLNDLNF